jgi:hypothetical protein
MYYVHLAEPKVLNSSGWFKADVRIAGSTRFEEHFVLAPQCFTWNLSFALFIMGCTRTVSIQPLYQTILLKSVHTPMKIIHINL